MTDLIERIATLLRDSGAAYAEFDPSATDGQCWIVETKDHWFTGLAEQIVDLVKSGGLTDEPAAAMEATR